MMHKNPLRFIFVFSLLLFALLELKGQDGLRFSLEDCIRYATTHNLGLQINDGRDVANWAYKSSREQLAPTVSASASQGFGYHLAGGGTYSWNGNYGLGANMILFKGLQNYNQIKQNYEKIQYADFNHQKDINDLTIQIINAYLQTLMNMELLHNQEQVLNSSKAQLKEGEINYKVGNILESDYQLLQAQYQSDSGNIIITQLSIENNLLIIKNLLAIPLEQTFGIIPPDSNSLDQDLSIPDYEIFLQKAINEIPDLQIIKHNLNISEYDVKLAKSAYYPTLGLNADIGTAYNGNETAQYGTQLKDGFGTTLGLTLNIPIYQGSSARYQVQLANKNLKINQLQQEQLKTDIFQTLKQCYLEVNKAYQNFVASDVLKKAYHTSYLAYIQKFKHGSITVVDLLQQQTNYLNRYNQYLQDKYAFVLNRKILDVYMGEEIKFN